LEAEHAVYTKSWAKASDLQQGVLKAEIERLEREINLWKPRTVPLSERLSTLYAAEAELREEREKLLAEWPALEAREKGEAMRRLFKKVTLFWEKTHHPPLAKPPRVRPRKTARKGRYSYTLRRDQIRWEFSTLVLDDSW
jgi:hypothetical protein